MNRKAAALIASYMVIAVLTILGTAFMASGVSESKIAKYYVDSTRALFIAEAGLNRACHDIVNGHILPTGQVAYAGGYYQITRVNYCYGTELTSRASFNGRERAVRGLFVYAPYVFDNTLSVGGNLSVVGFWARVEVHDKTRISGIYSDPGKLGRFDDKQEGVDQSLTTIRIPNYNQNGVPDEFNDFVLFGRQAVAAYCPDEVVYIVTNGTINIFPNQSLVGKKVIFVEGNQPGKGNVNILFDGTWEEGEDLTVIATGTVNYISPLQYQASARLSIICWDSYTESSVFRSEHESMVYTHQNASFVDILDWGSATGNIIANGNVRLTEVLTNEKFYYSDKIKRGNFPPALEFLCGSAGTPQLHNWREIS